jgi:hypothetical protein
MKYLIFLSILLSIEIPVQATVISGKITHIKTYEEIGYASVVLLHSDSCFVAGTQSNDKGEFILKGFFPAGDYILKISCVGFSDHYISLVQLNSDINLGEILLNPSTEELQEVVIQSNRIIQQANRQIILPTSKQKEISDNGIDFLFHLNLQNIRIDPLQQTISKFGKGNIQLKINGRNIEMQELVAIRPSEVLRIDYYDEPGARYAGDSSIAGIIDIITKQPVFGGFVALDATNAFTTGFANDQVTSVYNYKNSGFSVLYKLNYRFYDELRVNQEDCYHFPDETIQRNMEGINSPFGYTYHTINAGYSYKKGEKTAFHATLENNSKNRTFTDLHKISFLNSSIKTESKDYSKSRLNSPSIDFYFQQKWEKEQALYLNVVATYMKSDAERNYWNYQLTDTITTIWDKTKGEKYSLIGEGIYERKINESTLQGGFKYTRSYTDNQYIQPDITATLLKQSDAYLYTEWSGKIKKINYSIGIGGSRIEFTEAEQNFLYYIFRPLLRLNYSINNKTGLNYVFRIRPVIPSLGNFGNVVRTVDEFSVKQGNPYLKPYKTYYNALNFYYNKNRINTGISIKHNYEIHPVMGEIKLSKDLQQFIYFVDGQKYFYTFNTEINGTWYFPKDFGSILGIAGYSRYESIGNSYRHSLADFYLYLQLQLQYKKLNLTLTSVLCRDEELYGENIYWSEKNTQIVLKYKQKSFSIGLGISNPMKGNSWNTASRNLSSLVNSQSQTYINNNNNMVFINLSYNFSYGYKYSSIKKKLHNSDSDSGIMEIKD